MAFPLIPQAQCRLCASAVNEAELRVLVEAVWRTPIAAVSTDTFVPSVHVSCRRGRRLTSTDSLQACDSWLRILYRPPCLCPLPLVGSYMPCGLVRCGRPSVIIHVLLYSHAQIARVLCNHACGSCRTFSKCTVLSFFCVCAITILSVE